MGVHNDFHIGPGNLYSDIAYDSPKQMPAADQESISAEGKQPTTLQRGDGFKVYGESSLIGKFFSAIDKVFGTQFVFKKEIEGKQVFVVRASYENFLARKVMNQEIGLTMNQIYNIVKGLRNDEPLREDVDENKIKESFKNAKEVAVKIFDEMKQGIDPDEQEKILLAAYNITDNPSYDPDDDFWYEHDNVSHTSDLETSEEEEFDVVSTSSEDDDEEISLEANEPTQETPTARKIYPLETGNLSDITLLMKQKILEKLSETNEN